MAIQSLHTFNMPFVLVRLLDTGGQCRAWAGAVALPPKQPVKKVRLFELTAVSESGLLGL